MRGNRALTALVVVFLFVSSTVAVAGAPVAAQSPDAVQQQAGPTIRGSPDLAVSVAQPTINAGETNSVTLQVTNDGDLDLGPADARALVTTARNVRVEADADNTPLTVETGTVAIGSVAESRPGEAPIAVGVPSDVDPGTYEIDVEVRYSHTYQQSGNVVYDRQKTIDREVTVEVSDDARFEITNVTTDAQVGDQGTLEAEIKNIGADTASEATVTLESASAGLAFGQSPRDSARVGHLEPGETATVTYDVAFAGGAPVRDYALDGTVTFDTSEGYQRVDQSPSASVRPGAEQQFTIDNVESDLYVGEQGDIQGTVTNDGPATARNVVVQYAEQSPNVIPVERSVAVGTLGPGESAEFRLPIEVGQEAEAVASTADIAVQYRTAELERRAYQDLELLFDIAPERDRFDVAVADRTLETGGARTLSVEVTNNLNETVGDVEARLFTDDPIATGDTDTGYAQTIEPGETVTMTFDLSATASATPGSTYPISFDFRYDDANGDSQLSDTVRVPIDVTESESGGLPIGPIVVLLVVVIGAGGAVVWYRRR
ncbi:COG1361 S-layer family protein [Halorubrum ezzemoulense]|uniref:Exo-alpha-sialidase n=1 Tax=Halorubrum ezzemoulense TaxID=337243 RepID=A0A256IV12_HALEZ|nr:COG1361 S-layer family protein [Halorubrum ezzemoulense]OYR59947.1 exo-alpha-sialidase [Halorubrum ezzemoulense]